MNKTKCPGCGVTPVYAARDAYGKLVVLDPRIRVFSVVSFKDPNDEEKQIHQITRTTLAWGEHVQACKGGSRGKQR